MIVFQNEKNIVKKIIENEINELQEYAKQQGFADEQARTFIKNSVVNSMESRYEGWIGRKSELAEVVDDELKRMGIEI